MAIQKIAPQTNSPSTRVTLRQQFEEKLAGINGVRWRQEPLKKYKSWKIFCNYIFIRTYAEKLTIHAVGDIDHYEQKEVYYKDIPLNVSDLEFLHLILTDFKKAL